MSTKIKMMLAFPVFMFVLVIFTFIRDYGFVYWATHDKLNICALVGLVSWVLILTGIFL